MDALTARPARDTASVVAPPWLHLALAVAVGAWLRLHGIERQIVVDDEWHALHEILHRSWLDLLLDDGWTATGDHYSVPYALFFKALVGSVGLSELGMRLPSLLAGLALVVVLPLLVRRELGDRTSAAFAYLLAVSPLLIFFSRFARPYAPSLLFSFLAVCGLYAWTVRRSRGGLLLPVAAASFAALLHASTLTIFAAPAAYAVVAGGGGRTGMIPRLRGSLRRSRLIVLALAVVAVVLILLPYARSPVSLQRVLFHDPPSWQTVHLALELWLGSARAGVVVGLVALAVLGATRAIGRERNRFLGYLLFVALAQVAGMALLSPRGFKFGIVFARFCLFALPVLLLLIAAGLDRLIALLPTARKPVGSVAAALCGVLYIAGPLPRIDFYPNAFTNHGSWQCDYLPGRYFDLFAPRCIPSFYARLARLEPGTVRVVEAPWYYYWHSFAFYQRLHRQEVLIGFVDEKPTDVRIGELPIHARGYRFANMVHVADDAALARRHVDVVVLHKDAFAEMRIPFADIPAPVEPWRRDLARRFGAPLYEDGDLAVYFVGDDDARRELLARALADPTAVPPGLPVGVCDSSSP